jgi:hypothetical protein
MKDCRIVTFYSCNCHQRLVDPLAPWLHFFVMTWHGPGSRVSTQRGRRIGPKDHYRIRGSPFRNIRGAINGDDRR